MVANEKPNLRRWEYDQLKAILYTVYASNQQVRIASGIRILNYTMQGESPMWERMQALWKRVQW